MKLSFKILFIIIVVFTVFFPSIFGEIISGDDHDLYNRLEKISDWNLIQYFSPGISSRLYYRPINAVFYHFDKMFWGANPIIMHVENILLHGVSSILVYFISQMLLEPYERKTSLLPFIAALLFAVHPLTAESVSWISGRTDLTAGVFILSSALLLLKYRERPSLAIGFLAFGAFTLAAFAKEVAVAFLPGGICLIFSKSENLAEINTLPFDRRHRKMALCGTLWLIASFALFYVVRFVAHSNLPGKIGLTLKIIYSDLWHSAFVCLRGLGFYFKKFFIPTPLNFGIIEVDPLYELLGIIVVLFVLYLIINRTLSGSLVVAGAFMVTPSFLLLFNQIAWTPYAERYLYIPLAFFVPSFVVFWGNRLYKHHKMYGYLYTIIVLIVFSTITFNRSIIWSSNLRLWEDTVVKSPYFISAYNDYGLALYNDGQMEKAIEQFSIAANYRGVDYSPRYGVNLGIALMAMGRFQDSQKAILEALELSKGKDNRSKSALQDLFAKRIGMEKDETVKRELENELRVLLSAYDNLGGK